LVTLAKAEHCTQEDNQAGLAEDAVIKVCAVIKLAGHKANKQVEMPMPMLFHIDRYGILRSSIILPSKPDVKTSFCEPAFFKEVKDVFPKRSKMFVPLRRTFICRPPQKHSASTPHW
jgi:hypothetical protein